MSTKDDSVSEAEVNRRIAFANMSQRKSLCATYQHGALIGTPGWPKWAPDELSA